jgi:PAS domain S-box-containing protein
MIVAYSRDINLRKRLEQRLKTSEAYYKSLLHGSSDLITVADQTGAVSFVSDSIQRILGYRPEEVIGENILSFVDQEDLALAMERLSKAADPSNLPVKIRVRRKDGTWCACERTGRMATGPDGNPLLISNLRDVSERDQIDREHALLAALVKSSEDAIVSHSTDFRITSWNRGAQRLLGYTAEEALGKRPFDLYVLPAERARAREQMTQDLATIAASPETLRQLEIALQRKDGTLVEVSILGGGIHDSNGKLIGLSAIMRDITESKRVVRENAQLAAIVESSDDAITTLAPDLRVTYWNRGAERLFGYTAAETIGEPFLEKIPPELRAQARGVVDHQMAHPDEVVRFEGPLPRKDGTTVEVSTVCVAIRDAEGKVVAMSSIQRDLTERKREERKAALLAAIVNASQDSIMNVSSEGKILFWNPGAEKAYGYTAEEAVGKSIDLFVAPEELEETTARTRRVVETGEGVSWEQNALRRDGSRFISAVNIFPMRDESGRITSVAGIGRDITALKETERALVAAREAALAASEAKSEFLSSMSHEIRTPMTAILGMAELLGESQLNAEQRRYIEILCNNGNSLLDLINSVLDLAKIESGRLTLERVAFDLNEVVERAAQTLAIRAHAKRLELIVSIASDVPTALLGDPLRLRQVLINLIGNAIKFTERGEVLVTVEFDSASGEPLLLKFAVRDTGIGIASNKLPALFAAFSQADSSTARKYGGSGLGLAIVKRLVNLMQGEVTMESELGKGSVFGFIAPFERQPDAPAAAPPWPELERVPVLIVDGNQTERAVLRRMLDGRGAIVTEAESYAAGVAAFEAAGKEPAARIVLLSDRIGTADDGGIEPLIAGASSRGASIIAMIFCDNLAADISRLNSLKLENYLVKPLTVSEVAKAVRNAIVGNTAEAPADRRRDSASEASKPQVVDRPLKILFADDSADNRTLVRALLKKTPYHLDEVENGRQAIDGFIAAGDYDLVLMDIQMPEVDGYQATRTICEWERAHSRTHTPIIALTASVFPEAIRLARAAGCDAHLGKPISKASLLGAIYDAVGGASQA